MKKIAFVLLLALAGAASSFAADKLNVLLIISDGLRDTVGRYGNTAVKTPIIDGWPHAA